LGRKGERVGFGRTRLSTHPQSTNTRVKEGRESTKDVNKNSRRRWEEGAEEQRTAAGQERWADWFYEWRIRSFRCFSSRY
jgi:hypothetical protein